MINLSIAIVFFIHDKLIGYCLILNSYFNIFPYLAFNWSCKDSS